MIQCYNRGCGQKYDPNNNADDACRHHPGEPFFHDAYKGWTCCKKKSVDFTEFLNIKGCTYAKHSNEKPPESCNQKPSVICNEIPTEAVKSNHNSRVENKSTKRPSSDMPLINISPFVHDDLRSKINALVPKTEEINLNNDNNISMGTPCKNLGCKSVYTGTESDLNTCQYHAGTPIFHEGLKYWSCCTKKTSDFTNFLNQVGCTFGEHKWNNSDIGRKTDKCRYDWHQTNKEVVISVYAKLYDYTKSFVKVNSTCLNMCIFFVDKTDAFTLDIELDNVIVPEKAAVKMLPTKVEVTLIKDGPSKWSRLSIPRTPVTANKNDTVEQAPQVTENDSDSSSDVDIDDIKVAY